MVLRGVSGQAAIDPAKGASEIHELANQICRLYRLPKISPGISLNVGTISGGTRANVVADEARAIIDVRAVTRDEMDAVDGMVRRQRTRNPATRVEVSGGVGRPPLRRRDWVVRLYDQGREIARA